MIAVSELGYHYRNRRTIFFTMLSGTQVLQTTCGLISMAVPRSSTVFLIKNTLTIDTSAVCRKSYGPERVRPHMVDGKTVAGAAHRR